MKTQQVLNCSFSSWYSQFKNVTIKSRILDIPEDVLEYLKSDGTLVLPQGSTNGSSSQDDDNKWESEGATNEAPTPHFPEFEAEITRSLTALGGHIFPKLNWSSPKDAAWIAMNNTLKCSCSGDIYLLLKSSEFITHDLTQPFDRCEDRDSTELADVKYQLVLRRWHDLNPGGEFRCFVKNSKLLGVCQRHNSNFYPFISPHKEDILSDITDFYNRVVKGKFPDPDFVFDVYRKQKSKVYILDFNPWGEVTDCLMFSWDELLQNKPLGENQQNNSENVAFRFVETQSGVQPSPYRSYGLPQDFVDLSTGSDPYKLMDFLQLKNLMAESSDSESSQNESEGSNSNTGNIR